MTNKFENFWVSFKEKPNQDNFHKLHFDIYQDGEYKGTLSPDNISLHTAILLASTNVEEVKEGFKLYKKSVEFWLNRLNEVVNP